MPEYSEHDRVRLTRPFDSRLEGQKGTVQWVQKHKGQTALGVRLDGDDSGQTFFPHELEPADETDA